ESPCETAVTHGPAVTSGQGVTWGSRPPSSGRGSSDPMGVGSLSPPTCGWRRFMIRKLLGLAAAVLLPSLLAAQTPTIPNDNASDRGKAMVALHSQGAQHRATHRRGDVVHAADVDHDRDDSTRTADT